MKIQHDAWMPDHLVGPTYFSTKPISRTEIMESLKTVRDQNRRTSRNILERLEAAISITDDAIYHMMRKQQ